MKLDKKYAVMQIQNDGVNHHVIKTTDELGEAIFQMQMGIDLVLVKVLKRDLVPTDETYWESRAIKAERRVEILIYNRKIRKIKEGDNV